MFLEEEEKRKVVLEPNESSGSVSLEYWIPAFPKSTKTE
jgi:hypothetical protein